MNLRDRCEELLSFLRGVLTSQPTGEYVKVPRLGFILFASLDIGDDNPIGRLVAMVATGTQLDSAFVHVVPRNTLDDLVTSAERWLAERPR